MQSPPLLEAILCSFLYYQRWFCVACSTAELTLLLNANSWSLLHCQVILSSLLYYWRKFCVASSTARQLKVIKKNLTTGKVQITRNKHFIEGMHFLKLLNECFFFFKQLYPNSWMNKSWFNAVNIVINWTRKKFASLFYVKVDCKNSTGFIIDLNSLNYRLFFIQIQLTSCNSCKSPEYMTFKIYKNSSWKIFSVYI